MESKKAISDYLDSRNLNELTLLQKQIKATFSVRERHPALYTVYTDKAWDFVQYALEKIDRALNTNPFQLREKEDGKFYIESLDYNSHTAMDYFSTHIAPLQQEFDVIMLSGDGVYCARWALENNESWLIISYDEGSIQQTNYTDLNSFKDAKQTYLAEQAVERSVY